jgi:hypothetical protein
MVSAARRSPRDLGFPVGNFFYFIEFLARFRKAQFVAKTPLQFAADLYHYIWQQNAFCAEIRHI